MAEVTELPKESEKECKRHGMTTFVLRSNGHGQTYRCKKCLVNIYSNFRANRRKKIIKMLGGKCTNCGYDKCQAALDIHHIDESTKVMELGAKHLGASWEKILKELDKCILLCSNCHRELHSRCEGENGPG